MLTYLADGWFSTTQPQRPHTAVLGGVLDSAGLLCRAQVSVDTILTLRRLLVRHGSQDTAEGQQLLLSHLHDCTDHNPVLQSFMVDCLESAEDSPSMAALCAHLEHIAQAMAVLQAARRPKEPQEGITAVEALGGRDYSLEAPLRQARNS